jgi:uridine kinase
MKLQPKNGMIIKSFYMDMRDKELMRIMPLLVFLSEMHDVRILRDWMVKFNDEPIIDYTDKLGEDKKLNRNAFLKYVVYKIHTEHLDFVFHENGDKTVVVNPPKKSTNKLQPCCEEMDDELATSSDVDFEEIHKYAILT